MSDKHLRDIAGMIKVQGDRLDQQYITTWAEHLGATAEWQLIVERLKDQ